MTLKQRAIIQTAGILTAIVAGSVAISLILKMLTTEQIVNGFALLSIGLLIYSMYSVVLSRLEYNETVKKLVDMSAK
jgi:hypothetical protein